MFGRLFVTNINFGQLFWNSFRKNVRLVLFDKYLWKFVTVIQDIFDYLTTYLKKIRTISLVGI